MGCPGHEIIDPDGSEDHTIVLDCPDGDGVFHWDPAQKCIKMTREWDLDRSGKRRASETITCTGTVFDKDEETDTAEVRLHLSNCHLTYAVGDYRNDPYPSVCASVLRNLVLATLPTSFVGLI